VNALALSTPAEVQSLLEQIQRDLASRQNLYEESARRWFHAKREIEKRKATAYLLAGDRPANERRAAGVSAAYEVDGVESEAEYEALKAAIGVLETRASICMSILKAQGRA
jgi:hypothetical protein